ncbi:putative dual specificity protein phosphatase DSP8 isoform X1 [Brassica rapa]|uniref:putative dual specificity protein phosphatase DSP8 isoform X1 n=2 Tax=Brassica campestris TaxID=3711 RepID=UPI00142D32E1|nr:putative dual specificity protein phosphatase DSP8 isoform X1 [Brassica rapa]
MGLNMSIRLGCRRTHFALSSFDFESPAAMKDETEEDDETQRSSLGDGVSKNHKKKKKGIGFKGDKAKRAVIGAGGRILFYPTLLYNLLRFKLQSEFRWWDQIDEFLLMGAVPFRKDVPRLKQLGVGGVITLNEPFETLVPSSLYNAFEMEHLLIPTRDYLFAPSIEDITRAVNFIHQKALLGKTTYVHCKAGRGRSTTVVLCYLIEHKSMTVAAAFEHVRSIRPRVLLHPSQRKVVEEFKKIQSLETSDAVS